MSQPRSEVSRFGIGCVLGGGLSLVLFWIPLFIFLIWLAR